MKERRSRGGARVISPIKRALLVGFIVVLVVLAIKGKDMLNAKKLEYNVKLNTIEGLKEEINIEESKALKYDKVKNQITSDEDYESLAREELGLIRKDEIVIKPR